MNIGILTVNDFSFHPNKRLKQAANKLGHKIILINPYDMIAGIKDKSFEYSIDKIIDNIDVIMPRQGSPMGDYGLVLLRQFNKLDIPLVNDLESITITRNQYTTLQVLMSSDISVPDTYFITKKELFKEAVNRLEGFPVIVKQVDGMGGTGVVKIDDEKDALKFLEQNLKNKKGTKYPTTLPDDVVQETTRRYRDIYSMITDDVLPEVDQNVQARLHYNLVKHNIIKDGFVAIIMGSTSDLDHCNKMKGVIEKYDIKVDMRVVSAHKNGEDIGQVIKDYNLSTEPGAIIAVAGRSNGLGGALAANTTIPVISCPPFSDKDDMMVNINSSLIMPSNTPGATVVDPKNAALLALRSLNLARLKGRFDEEITKMKEDLRQADKTVRGK